MNLSVLVGIGICVIIFGGLFIAMGIYVYNYEKNYCNTWAYKLDMWIHRKRINKYLMLKKFEGDNHG